MQAGPSKWVPLPQDGLLELDFSTGRRPKPDTQAIGAEALLPHLQAVKDAVALILSQKPLHLPSCFGSAALRPLTQQLLPLPLTASQAVTLCLGAGFVGLVPGKSYPDLPDEGEEEEGECAPPNDVILEELRIQACLRAELLQRMFQGVIDLENLFREVSTRLSEQDCDEIGRRIGLLNMWNPLQPGCALNLRVEIPDERHVAAALLSLASQEEVDATPRTARGLGPPLPPPDAKKGKPTGPADLLPPAGEINISYEAERETARFDLRLILARESFLVGHLVSGGDTDDSHAIKRLMSQ